MDDVAKGYPVLRYNQGPQQLSESTDLINNCTCKCSYLYVCTCTCNAYAPAQTRARAHGPANAQIHIPALVTKSQNHKIVKSKKPLNIAAS